jgi:hypothetical protein
VDTEKAAKKKDATRGGLVESDDDASGLGLLDVQSAKRQRTTTAEEEQGSRKKKRRSHGESATGNDGSKGEKIFHCDLNFSQLSTYHSPTASSWPTDPIN